MKKTQRDTHAERFADYVIRRLEETRLQKSELARRAEVTRQTIGQIAGKKAHHLTGKLLLPERETVDRIAKAFGDPISIARTAAGYSVNEEKAGDESRLLKYYRDLNPEYQRIAMALMETLYGQSNLPPSPEIEEGERFEIVGRFGRG
jgi:transcriptional regulator with XRE-family HTH domain